MSVLKPLSVDEVPKEYRDRIIFSTNRTAPCPQRKGGKTYSVVDVMCDMCDLPKQTSVNDIRNWARGVRKNFPGTHRECKYERRYINHDEYEMVLLPDHPNAMGNGYVSGHILAMSTKLGRPLDTKNESVHHIDGDHANNDISNLQLRRRYHGKGQKYECLDCGSHNISTTKI